MFPVVILLESLSLVLRRLLEIWVSRQLPSKRRVGRTVLNCGVSVPEITEVVDIARGQECTSGE